MPDAVSEQQRAKKRRTARDALSRLADADCPLPNCEGTLSRGEFKDTDAVVCPDCETPAVRVWGEEP
ncbi:HVO_A0556 family zinc finger protein [Halorussus halophilus]|uniref:HVO_A0556 family zinc finger protein n=1 Tax=Halorussus halophilus TaxID=2650975 RepID=UPI001301734F|nr:HVO_A0556 family zinc finger protein [Halorussus halophilus]